MVRVPDRAKKGSVVERWCQSGGSVWWRMEGMRRSWAMAGPREGSMKSRMWKRERWVREGRCRLGGRVRRRTWAMSW
jgi:hypothetical protein